MKRRGLEIPMVAAGITAFVAVSAAAGEPSLPFSVGERLEWSVSYAGVRAGSAWSVVQAGEDGSLVFQAGCRNAAWYERIYHIDDALESHWDPRVPGSTSYVTRFREGNFHQDQRMEILPDAIRVFRKQRFKDGWREWTDTYAGSGSVEDPLSAFYRIRVLPLEPGAAYGFPVFSGKRTWALEARVSEREVLDVGSGPVTVLPVDVATQHHGDVEQRGRLRIYLSDDARRVPVRVIVQTNVGHITADLRVVRSDMPTDGSALE